MFGSQYFGGQYWASPYWGGAAPVIAYAGDEILSAIETWFAATPAISSLFTGSKLWHKTAPETTLLPYATQFLVSEPVEEWTTDYPLWRSTVQINLHANLPKTARAHGRALRAAIKNAPLVVNGSRVMHCLPIGSACEEGEGLGPRGLDCWVDMETFDILWTEEPTS